MIQVSAPTKLMIIGEYTVLEGGPAVVTAINRRVRACYSPCAYDGSALKDDASHKYPHQRPEVVLTHTLAQQKLGANLGELRVDMTELQQPHELKLGIGSSSAATVAVAGAAYACAGFDIGNANTKHQIFELALAGHQAVAPQGSGADVAAAVYGETIQFQRTEKGPTITSLRWPESLHLTAIWTQTSARTSDFLHKLFAFKSQYATSYHQCQTTLRHVSEQFITALQSINTDALLKATQQFTHALHDLGKAAELPILTPQISAICNLANDYGGAAKPSGAGGGDVCIAFFRDLASKQAFEDACRRDNFPILAITCNVRGVALD